MYAAPGTTASQLHSCLASVLRSNKAERDTIVAILGFCGILATRDHPGYDEHFVDSARRHLPDRHFVDMKYPACWWRRSDGIDADALHEYFGHVV